MNHTQLQQEPETALPHTEALLRVAETEDVETPLETSEVASEQSAVVEKLLAAMEQNTRKRQKWNSIASGVYLTVIVVYSLLVGIGEFTGHTIVRAEFLSYLSATNVFGWVMGALLLDRKAAAQLTQFEDVRCIGPLLEIWNPQGAVSYSKRRRQTEAALTRLLPLLKASDAPLLKEHQRVILRAVLDMQGYKQWGKYYDTRFLLAILLAVTEIGDWKSAAAVSKLSQTSRDPKLRQAAAECLPFLQDMAKKQAVGETLLRASSATEAVYVAPETLLRPASPTADAQPETLLRSVE